LDGGTWRLKTVGICGHFAIGKELLDGQTVKTKIVHRELVAALGEEQVMRFDTHGGVKKLVKLPFWFFGALRQSKNVIIMPAINGIRLMAPMLAFLNCFFKRRLHYVVIGGWIASILDSRKWLERCLKRFHCIYVETSTVKIALEKRGFHNVAIMPNCKELTQLDSRELVYHTQEPYPLCTFSRVMREKGIEDAVCAVKRINERLGRTVYSLDIYGQVDSHQTEWFNDLMAQVPDYVRYRGMVPFDRSVEVLQEYFALLFPTKFFTEGIPGTIIDAYAAGIPVISSRWESCGDMVDEQTGVIYEFTDEQGLENALFDTAQDPQKLNLKKTACMDRAQDFLPKRVIGTLISKLECEKKEKQ
jgi:glycosyltransferase involved in cell wall biosynthesis